MAALNAVVLIVFLGLVAYDKVQQHRKQQEEEDGAREKEDDGDAARYVALEQFPARTAVAGEL